MIRLSSGLRRSMITSHGLQAMMNYGRIYLYTGQQPASANDAPSGTLLGYISNNGDAPVPGTTTGGLILVQGFDAGTLEKFGTWTLKGIAQGTVGWWRFVWNASDSGSVSQTNPRIDGSYGDSFVMSDPFISVGQSTDIASFIISFPNQ